MKKIFYTLIILSAALILSSCTIISYDTTELPKDVQNYLHENKTDIIHNKVSETGENIDYNCIKQSFTVYEDIETLWSHYMKSAPIISCDSRRINFGVVFNIEDAKFYSPGAPWTPPLSEGQIYILNLIFMDFYDLQMVFKISRIDREKKIIEFIYLNNSLVNGFQQISFNVDYDTEGIPISHIEHSSYFKCPNNFIDTFLYPPFHRNTINEFHENIFKYYGMKGITI